MHLTGHRALTVNAANGDRSQGTVIRKELSLHLILYSALAEAYKLWEQRINPIRTKTRQPLKKLTLLQTQLAFLIHARVSTPTCSLQQMPSSLRFLASWAHSASALSCTHTQKSSPAHQTRYTSHPFRPASPHPLHKTKRYSSQLQYEVNHIPLRHLVFIRTFCMAVYTAKCAS